MSHLSLRPSRGVLWCAVPLILACTHSTPPPITSLPPNSACMGSAVTSIPTIQGRGDVSLMVGQVVTTVGVVVGDFEGPSPALQGFYIQDAVGDRDPDTSDGLFVFNGNADSVSLGDLVRVTGVVEEAEQQTRIGNVSAMVRCADERTINPVTVTLPTTSASEFERYEGMFVRFSQTLVVTENVQLGRFGQLVVSAGNRLIQPTQRFSPGPEAAALQETNARNRLIVDDGTNAQNPDPILFGRRGAALTSSNTIRGGDEVRGLVGVMTHTWGGQASSGVAYRLRPMARALDRAPMIESTNRRTVAPDAVDGTLRVSAFNVLNYFNTFGTGACALGDRGASTDCRGAANAADFERQAAKIVSAIRALDPDILGIMEIENDGYGTNSAIADLVRRLNDATAPGTFAFINADEQTSTRNTLGTDAIKVGLLYKPARLSPTGRTAVLATNSFVTGGDSRPRTRPSLAQAFAQPDGEVLVVSVNHLKSKSGSCDVPDARDGQGQCNIVRTNGARELAEWLATDPTGVRDPDVLLIGDLNAYAKEDPVTMLTSRGYVDLETSRGIGAHYSYVFDGQWGSLDHALASRALAAQVTGVTTWHINADEPAVLGYESAFKSPAQRATLYAPDPYRSSDHDPVLVGITLRRASTRNAAP